MLHLNNEQLRAVRHVDGPMLVLAGPGSGKTAVITERIRYLMGAVNVKAESILVLTFSNKAAREMQRRLNESSSVCFGTFHSFFFHVLKQYKNYNSDSIIKYSQQVAYIRDVGIKLNIKPDIDERWCMDTLSEISVYKNTGQMPKYLLDDELKLFPKVFEEYCLRLKKAGYIDFDDMIRDALELLRSNPLVLGEIKDRFKYILVDEFQDCNKDQYELLKLISQDNNNLFAVGDDDQAIYAFRGSDTRIILKFLSDYPNCGYVELIRNYRCSGNIIDKAFELIGHNQSRKTKQKQLPSLLRGNGEVYVIKTEDAYSEAAEVYEIIDEVMKKGVKSSDISVLYRTDTASDYLTEYLSDKKIVSNKTGRDSLKDKEYVKDILAYLNISQGDLSRENFYRILNKPDRGLIRDCIRENKTTEEAMMSYYGDDIKSRKSIHELFDNLLYIKDLRPYAAIQYIWKKIGYGKYCGMGEVPNELLSYVGKYKDIKSFILSFNEKTRDKNDGVVLQTIHASKGLEYDTVIIIGLQEGIMPHSRAGTEEDIEEERRLMYVAMTRAKNRLYIIARGKESHGKKYSRFIYELNVDYKSISS